MLEDFGNSISALFVSLHASRYLFIITFLLALYVVDRIAVKFLSRFVEKAFKQFSKTLGDKLVQHTIVRRLAHIAPAFVVNVFIPTFEKLGFSTLVINIVHKITSIYIIIILTSVILSIINAIQGMYKKFEISSKLPVKNYLQIIKIIIVCLSIILVVSVILGKSPLVWLTSFGAIAAIFSLAFKESVSAIVAGIEIAVYDVIQVGNWISVPKFNADGSIIDITLTRVKIQNFDKTISFVPTTAILESGVKNWQGMFNAGGRRIKKAMHIDAHDIKVLSEDEITKLAKNDFSAAPNFDNELAAAKNQIGIITNEILYRRYIYNYLQNRDDIHQEFLLVIRQLAHTENGLPIEVYCYTTDTKWRNHEDIQADIFSHLFAILPLFDLKTYQLASNCAK